MGIKARLDKVEKTLKSTNKQGGERFFIIDTRENGTLFDVQYQHTSKDGKPYKENIPSMEGLTAGEYEEYKAKYINEDTFVITGESQLED